MKLNKVDDKTAYENLLVKYAELENKIADIKANCDLAIEGRDVKIRELELELTVEKDQHQEENTELKEEMKAKQVVLNDFKSRVETVTDRFDKKSSQLTKAKEIIKGLLSCCRNYPQENADKMKQAEQFLQENEDDLKEGCLDVLCEDCTKEDCTVRKLGLVPNKEIEK